MSTLEPNTPAYDTTNFLQSLMASIDARLRRQRLQEIELIPQHDDEDNYIGDMQTAAASATTTITWTFKKDYEYYFKKIYVDAVANATYEWEFSGVKGFYEGIKTMEGNEHEFDKPIVAGGGTTLKLEITNNGVAIDLDIIIRSWARREQV